MRFNFTDLPSQRLRDRMGTSLNGERALPGSASAILAMVLRKESHHQAPVFSMDIHGSAGARLAPFCNISMEIPSGERTNAI